MFVYVPDESRRTSPLAGIHPESHNRRVGSDTLGKRRSLAKRRHGRHAALQVVLTPKAKPDSASDLLSGGSPHRYHTCSSGRGNLRKPKDPTTPALVQLYNESPTGSGRPMRLSFEDEERSEEKHDDEPEDLRKPYKEVLKSPFSRRIIEFSAPNHRTPTNLKIYDGSTDPDDHITCFVGAAYQGEWEMPVWCRMFQQTLDGPARGWFDCLPNGCIENWTDMREAFVERFTLRWKCCKDPTEVSKIVRRANETLPYFKERWTKKLSYIPDVPIVMQISSFMSNSKCPELARRFSNKVPKTVTEMIKRVDDFVKSKEVFKNTKLPKGEYPMKDTATQFRGSRSPRHSHRNGPSRTDVHHRMDQYQPYVPPRAPDRRYDNRRHDHRRQEVNHLRYCEYHGEKGHYTNDCFHLKKQLEVAMESRKLNHLIKDVRQMGNNQGRPTGSNNGKGKVINMVHKNGKDLKPVQVMLEHCFDHLSPNIKARLIPTQTELVGFSGEQLIPIGKIELEVQFRRGGLTRNVMMKFTVVRVSSPYNVILERTGLQELRAVSSTIHAMLKFPTPKGIVTLCARTEPVYEWEEKILVNPAFPEQAITIGTQISTKCREQLIRLLKDIMDVFAWQPSDMAGVSRRLIRHALNVNNFVPPVAQKRRVLGTKKSKVVTREVEEWVKARIVRPVKYPTWISNPVLVKKAGGTWRMWIDFKNLNAACLKDYYPLQEFDLKVKVVMGHTFKCFLDAYKGYHQVQMSKEDEEKTAFYTDQGRYYYVKMPFDLKNVGATYQWGRKFLRLHGYLGWNKGEPQENEGNSGYVVPKNPEGNAKLKREVGRLRWYFEAHLIKVIMDQPVKQILNKPEVSGKLSKNAVELGAYNITYIPRTAVKGQILADFINEVPVGTKHIEIHAPVPKLPKTRLTSIMSPWPFYQWGLDILGPLLEGPGKLKFIIVVIDYFTKLIEAKPLAKTIVNDPFKRWCEKLKIKQMNTAVAHPQANGLVERAKKSLMHELKARQGRERVGWVEELPNIMWAHRTMLKTSNGETLFNLTYGSEAIFPTEIRMPTYRTIHFNEAQNEEEMWLNLDLSQERRETSAIREAKYKKKVE
ncbi:reverse transcriptase domain-containing protein [Tanacetum coccineum]